MSEYKIASLRTPSADNFVLNSGEGNVRRGAKPLSEEAIERQDAARKRLMASRAVLANDGG